MKWKEVKIDNDYKDTIASVHPTFLGWYSIFELVNTSKEYHLARIEGGCSCYPNDFRRDMVDIPLNIENVVVLCNDCQRPMMRISGIVSKNWKMEVLDE